MKKIHTIVFRLLVCLAFPCFVQAQCDISNVSLTNVPGVCTQDGAIEIQVIGATDCSSNNLVTAALRLIGGTSDLDVIILSSSGAGTFFNLVPNTYEVIFSQNNLSVGPQTIEVTTTYTMLSDFVIEPINVSCASGNPLYSDNGSVDISFNGGTGPFLFELILGSTTIDSFSGPDRNHLFENLPAGPYQLSITDLSPICSSNVVQSTTVLETVNTPITLQHGRPRTIVQPRDDCASLILSVEVFGGNFDGLQIPGNVTYTIAGVTENFTLVSGSTTRYITKEFPAGSTLEYYVSDGCNIVTYTQKTALPDYNVLNYIVSSTTDDDCNVSTELCYNTRTDVFGKRTYHTLTKNAVTLEKEDPIGSNNYVVVEMLTDVQAGVSNVNGGFGPCFSIQDVTTNYRLTVQDVCHTVVRNITQAEIADAPSDDGLTSINITEHNYSVLEGTGSFLIGLNTRLSYSNPITTTIERVDGQTAITINPTQPLSLAGTYTASFPYVYTGSSERIFDSVFGDLPLGDYNVTFTDACGVSSTKSVSITTATSYNPAIDVIAGCGASDINYNMNQVAAVDKSLVSLLENNAGVQGAVVRDDSENASNQLVGQFSNVLPGEYFLVFNRIRSNNNSSQPKNFSVASGLNYQWQAYSTPVTVLPYKQVAFSTVSLFCEATDNDSGIIAVTITGTPISFITYEIWDESSNPGVDTPLDSYTTSDLTEESYVFSNLSEGNYIIRTTSLCGFTEQEIVLSEGEIDFPSPLASNPIVCDSASASSTLSIALPVFLFDISWLDSAGTIIGTGNSVTVSPTSSETYTVAYSLNAIAGCSNTDVFNDTVSITVNPSIEAQNTTTTCSSDGANNYTVRLEVINGTGPYVASGSGAPGVWMGNIWTSDAIFEADYTINIEDANACNTITVSGLRPEDCCAFDITCPTFNTTTISCYQDLPAATTITELEFEALGNGDGTIGDLNCGIIEITVQNSANTGNCNQIITRTYTITEYLDANLNGVRDTGEDTVLDSTVCTQDITVNDTTGPIIDSPATNVTVSCDGSGNSAEYNTWIAANGNAVASDLCSNTITWTSTIATQITDCINETTVTFIATDVCGNTTPTTAVFTISDTIAPEFTSTTLPQDLFIDCNTLPEAPELLATDNCSAVEVIFTETEQEGDCSGKSVVTRQWLATDACGNETVHTQVINLFCEIEVYNAVSTVNNGFLNIKGIDCFSTNTVKIFNRWGVLVFETSNYNNTTNAFKGISQGRITMNAGKELPTGTYFYIVQYEYNVSGNNTKTIEKSGYLYLSTKN